MTDREHWKALLPIIQAYADGKEIEFRTSHSDTWSPCTAYEFRFNPSQYRIKPKPTAADYAFAQDKCGIRVGDRVKVTRAAKHGEQGWNNGWNSDMSESIGRSGKVTDLMPNGMRISFLSTPICSGYYYPYFVLEKTEPNYRPFANAEEFAPHRDRWFRVKRCPEGVSRFSDYDDKGVFTSTSARQRWDELFENFVFDDGSPCGVLVDPDQTA